MTLLYSIILLLCVIMAYTAASCVFWYDKYGEVCKENTRLKWLLKWENDNVS